MLGRSPESPFNINTRTVVKNTVVHVTDIENSGYTSNPKQPAIADLGLTISNPPTQAEVQAVSDKVDALLEALRNAEIIS